MKTAVLLVCLFYFPVLPSVVLCSVTQWCPTLCDPIDYSSPGSSVHGIFQARILEKVAISSSRGSPQPRDRTHASCVSCIDRQILYQLHHLRKWSIITVSSFLEHRGRTSGLLRQKARSVHWVLTMPESQENFWDTCIYKSLSEDSLGITNQDDLKSVRNVWLQGLSTAPQVQLIWTTQEKYGILKLFMIPYLHCIHVQEWQ